MRITDEAICKFKEKFNNQPILDAQTLEEAVYELDSQLQNTLEEVAPLIVKKKDQSTKRNHGMANNSLTKVIYSKIEKENGLDIKHRTSS